MAEDAPAAPAPALFSSCKVAFIISNSLAVPVIAKLSEELQKDGAEVVGPDRHGQIPVSSVTHIISNDIDFEQYAEAQALMVPVVTAEWIKESIRRQKLSQVRPYSPDPRYIFAKVTVTCGDIPMSDKEAIIGATMALGGQGSKDVTRTTTHICALTMENDKCQQAIKKGLKCKIVLPHWFDDCFKLGKRIDETPYLLPDPPILRQSPEDEVKIPLSQHVEGATSTVPHTMALPEPGRSRKLVVFSQRKIHLSQDLDISDRLRKILQDVIKNGDGEVVDSAIACDTLVCSYRDGEEYVHAARSGKVVGNLSWLYHLVVHNQWTSPLRRLLHYPVPRNGIPGFEDMRITLSNYGGEARIYLENLIKAAGATYTKTMKADNTHLITARPNSEKCEAARDWNIATINHLWIEESYAKCEVLQLTNPKYTHFPSRTNLGEVIGQTFLDESRLHALYYPGGDEDLDAASKRRRNINDAAKENLFALGSAVTTGMKELKVRRDSSPSGSKAATATSRTRQYATPARARRVITGKENDTPSIASSGNRSAKAQALSKLHDLAPDVALYEKEKKRSSKDGHGPWGGKRAADQIDKEREATTSSAAEESDGEEEMEEAKRPAKKRKQMLPPAEMRIVLTGYKRWVGDKNKEDADRRKLRQMGIQIVAENVPCEYLAAPRMLRTMKFLRTLARGVEILDSSFIDACLDDGEVPNIKAHMLKDRENEKHFKVTALQATSRARANRGRLLWNVPVYCTDEIKNGPESYKVIAEANGAIFKIYRARGGNTIRPTTAEEDGGAAPDPVYLLTSNSAKERQLWPRFEEMARQGHMEPRIVISDWLLDIAMKQQLSFDENYLARVFFANSQ